MSNPWASSLLLEQGEWIVRSWKGNLQTKTNIVVDSGHGITAQSRYKTESVKHYDNGFLVLTNRRLVWLEAHGTFSKSYDTAFEIPLIEVRGLSIGGSVFKHITIASGNGPHTFHLDVGDKEFPLFKQLVEFQIVQRKQALEYQKKQERVHVMVDFSFLREYMEKGGLTIQTVKCSNCSAPIQLPSAGDTVKCEHCGSIQHVQDIFEKVKQLIG